VLGLCIVLFTIMLLEIARFVELRTEYTRLTNKLGEEISKYEFII